MYDLHHKCLLLSWKLLQSMLPKLRKEEDKVVHFNENNNIGIHQNFDNKIITENRETVIEPRQSTMTDRQTSASDGSQIMSSSQQPPIYEEISESNRYAGLQMESNLQNEERNEEDRIQNGSTLPYLTFESLPYYSGTNRDMTLPRNSLNACPGRIDCVDSNSQYTFMDIPTDASSDNQYKHYEIDEF